MLRDSIQSAFQAAIDALVNESFLPAHVSREVQLADPRNPEHGDFAVNYAMMVSKEAGKPPRLIAERLSEELKDRNEFEAIEVAGPGFMNLRLSPQFVASFIPQIIELGADQIYKVYNPAPKHINVEFVSVNPNGPITVGSGRNASFGDALARVLEATGNRVEREYYVNDGVNSEQMLEFARSVRHETRLGQGPVGEYARAIGAKVLRMLEIVAQVEPSFDWENGEAQHIVAAIADLPAIGELSDKDLCALAWPLDDPEELPSTTTDLALQRLSRYLKICALWKRNASLEEAAAAVQERSLQLNTYKGTYVEDVVAALPADSGTHSLAWFQEKCQELMIERQRTDLATFGIVFDTWFSEQSMHNSGKVDSALQKLIHNDAADYDSYSEEWVPEGKERKLVRKEEAPGPLWLRASRYGDEKDRVLTRSDGRPAYIAADVAYMESKLGDRKYDKAFTILGPDHHGYVARMNAVCQALGYDNERFEAVVYQIVRFIKEGKPAPMRKRDGNIYELRDLMRELGETSAPEASADEQMKIGADVTRFFYLMRAHETHMDFDIDLATKRTDENPLFYVQYAHARICSVLSKAAEAGFPLGSDYNTELLGDPRELNLLKKIMDVQVEVARCAEDYGVHRLATYANELARAYHHFYDGCRVIQADQPELTKARVALCAAAQIGLKGTLTLIGVNAPERM